MNTIHPQVFAEESQQSLVERLNDFKESYRESLAGKSKNELLQILNIWAKVIKENIKKTVKWPSYFYKKFTKQYEEIKPIAEELSNVLGDLALERKSDENFIEQFTDIPETEKDGYKKEIKEEYDLLEWYIIPIQTRLQQMEDIIKKIKELAFGDTDPKSVVFSIDFSLLRSDEVEELLWAFKDKYHDIMLAITAYPLAKRDIKELQQQIEKKFQK